MRGSRKVRIPPSVKNIHFHIPIFTEFDSTLCLLSKHCNEYLSVFIQFRGSFFSIHVHWNSFQINPFIFSFSNENDRRNLSANLMYITFKMLLCSCFWWSVAILKNWVAGKSQMQSEYSMIFLSSLSEIVVSPNIAASLWSLGTKPEIV